MIHSNRFQLNETSSIVIKVGSALLLTDGGLRKKWLEAMADDIAEIKATGAQVVVVSSGAIALGRSTIGFGIQRQLSLEEAQAAAAVGQIQLARVYQETLARHDIVAAQVLVTLDDTHDRRRYLNSRATIKQLLESGCVPIINENDTVATEEIRYGDNDRLGAHVATLIGADLLILLSDIDGLYDGNPKSNPAAEHIPYVAEITPEIERMAGGAGTHLAKGGMKTKLMAARMAMAAGCEMAIALGTELHAIKKLFSGGKCTLFASDADPQTSRRQWIASMNSNGTVHVDDGAATALASGSSLLPVGVTKTEGDYRRGDCVKILGPGNVHLAQGLVAYDCVDVQNIMGKQSEEIHELLGNGARQVLVHRDDMAI